MLIKQGAAHARTQRGSVTAARRMVWRAMVVIVMMGVALPGDPATRGGPSVAGWTTDHRSKCAVIKVVGWEVSDDWNILMDGFIC